MKQTFSIFLLLMLFASASQAQITINSDDIVPVGFVASQTKDTLPDASILEGGTGNIDWDFTELKPGLDAEFVLLESDQTPYAASFPNSNLTTQVQPGLFAYMTKDNDKIAIQGVEGDIDIQGITVEGQLEYTPNQSLIRFPATFGDSYQEEIVQFGQVTGAALNVPNFDSVRVILTLERTVDIEAHGQMTIPSGTYDCIRLTEKETSTTEIYVLTSGFWIQQGDAILDTLINYNWWTKTADGAFPLVSMVYDPQDGSREVTYLLELNDVENLFETEATLYPNPASNTLNIEFAEAFSGKIQLLNSIGQLVSEQQSRGNSFETVDLSQCTTGIHYVVLKDEKGNSVGHKKIAVAK